MALNLPPVRRQYLYTIAVGVALFGLAYPISRSLVVRRTVYAQVTATPFTLLVDTYKFDVISTGERFSTKTVARRSDGSTAELMSFGPLATGHFGRRVSFMDGRKIVLLDILKGRSTYRFAPDAEVLQLKARLTQPPLHCVFANNEYFRGTDTMMGQSVDIVQHESSRRRFTVWRAPSLGCEVLHYRMETDDGRSSFSVQAETRPVTLTLGEPHASLFDSGDTYVEQSPSALAHALAAKDKLVLNATDEKGLAASDRQYQRRQQK